MSKARAAALRRGRHRPQKQRWHQWLGSTRARAAAAAAAAAVVWMAFVGPRKSSLAPPPELSRKFTGAPYSHAPDLAEDVVGGSQLYLAAFEGDDAAVRRELDAGCDLEWRTDLGATPLFIAAYQGHDAVLELLLAAGAVVDAKANSGATPMLIAAQEGHDVVVARLLAAGAALEAKDNLEKGSTALYMAAQFNTSRWWPSCWPREWTWTIRGSAVSPRYTSRQRTATTHPLPFCWPAGRT